MNLSRGSPRRARLDETGWNRRVMACVVPSVLTEMVLTRPRRLVSGGGKVGEGVGPGGVIEGDGRLQDGLVVFDLGLLGLLGHGGMDLSGNRVS